MKRLHVVVFSLLLAATAGFPSPTSAHNGVDHGSAKHQKIAGTEVILDLQSLAKYKAQFGAPAGLQGSHVLTVRLLKGSQAIAHAEVKAKLVGPNKQVIGPESGQALKPLSAKGQLQHYATAYTLPHKGKYAVMVMFKVDGKVSQATFELVAS